MKHMFVTDLPRSPFLLFRDLLGKRSRSLPYRRRCAELGAEHFFDKADGLDSLLDVCRSVVAGRATVES